MCSENKANPKNDQESSGPFREAPALPPEDNELIRQYVEFGIPADKLAYSDEFKRLVEILKKHGDKRTEEQLFRRLLNLRKAGRLPRVA